MAPVANLPNMSILLAVDEQSQVGAARRAAVALGHTHGLSGEAVGRLALVVTEAATNIVRHASRGAIVLRPLSGSEATAIEVLALDKGPGMIDVARAMNDGYSTSGTRGQGLGAIKRLSDVCEIHSQRGVGTAVLARVGAGVRVAARPMASLDDRLGVICLPLRGETECGDTWRVVETGAQISVLLVDGLGHGPEAAAVATTAAAAFNPADGEGPDTTLATLDQAMRGGRGAAVSVAMIDLAHRVTHFGGVGNVDGRIVSKDATQHLVPQNGIVGHTMPVLRPTLTGWPVGARLVLHSDGISARWRLDAYTGLANAHPALLAGVIFRDFARERDDATVLVLMDTPRK